MRTREAEILEKENNKEAENEVIRVEEEKRKKAEMEAEENKRTARLEN
jgi:hypothetical protein